VTAARLVNEHGPIESFPPAVLAGERRELALLFKDLATLRDEVDLYSTVDDLRWRGPTDAWAACAEALGDERLLERASR
jgi:hypothetical protein